MGTQIGMVTIYQFYSHVDPTIGHVDLSALFGSVTLEHAAAADNRPSSYRMKSDVIFQTLPKFQRYSWIIPE